MSLKEKIRQLAKGYSIDRGFADRLNFPEKTEIETTEERKFLLDVVNEQGTLARIRLWGWSIEMYEDVNVEGSLDSYYLIAFIDGLGELQFYGIYDSFIEAWHAMENEYYKDAKDNS